jgi:hypothetical protein
MSVREIFSPGIQINEQNAINPGTALGGTTILVQGYFDKGTELTPFQVTSTDDLDTSFGPPQNAAEQYSYYSCLEILNQGGNLIVGKLPYNNLISDYYKGIGIKISTDKTVWNSPSLTGYSELASLSSFGQVSGGILQISVFPNSTSGTLITGPSGSYIADTGLKNDLLIHRDQYDVIQAGGDFTTADSLKNISGSPVEAYDFIIVNENKSRLGGANRDEGIFVVLVDPIDALRVQRMITANDNDAFSLMNGINYPSGILYEAGTGSASGSIISSFASPLTGTFIGSSFSEDLARQFPGISWTQAGTQLDPYYFHQLGVIVCSTTEDANNDGKIMTSIVESFVGSVHTGMKNPSNGQSIYLGDLINNTSNYIKWYSDYVTNNTTIAWSMDILKNDVNSILFMPDDKYPIMAFTDAECVKWIRGDTMVEDMKVIMQKLSNIDMIDIDVVLDAGLSTIAQYTKDNPSYGQLFDPINNAQEFGAISSPTQIEYWRNVCMELINFCSLTRKDCMCILDVPRSLVLDRNSKWVRKTAPRNSFSNTIGASLRYVTGLNNSYAALYSDWTKMIDDYSGQPFWAPPSLKAAGVYIYNDRNGTIADAPAGLNRGVINGIVDIAFNPNQKEADQVYLKSINYAKQYPLDGFTLEGQKTTLTKSSAFDRVNVRRLFLRLERLTYKQARYVIYEKNTPYARRSFVDTIDPIFQRYLASMDITKYEIVADERNNENATIDNNEFHCAILITPVRTMEFIMLEFIATRTGGSFSEIISTLG